jgi:uncharacterized protein YndB with AHSA1/START domain
MADLAHHLERSVVIRAKPETVFQFFTDSQRWASWWGEGSTIDAKPGGKVYIRHANGVETIGEVLEVNSQERIVFTYGYASGKPIAPGDSRVTVRLTPDPTGTRLHLRHEFAEAGPRDEHVQGWRFQLSLFSNVVANEVYADAANTVDEWFAAWMITDHQLREATFSKIAASDICFRDRYSLLDGLADLTAHTGAAQRFMPGIELQRKGLVRQCQGWVLAEWIAMDREGKERASGSSAFEFAIDGKIQSVTSFAHA